MTASKNSFAIALTALEVNRVDSVAIMAIKKCQAADELLKALEKIAAFAPGNGEECEIIAKIARAAIAKATA